MNDIRWQCPICKRMNETKYPDTFFFRDKTAVQCDYCQNPINIEIKALELSWIIGDGR